jgi:hypothetical protein
LIFSDSYCPDYFAVAKLPDNQRLAQADRGDCPARLLWSSEIGARYRVRYGADYPNAYPNYQGYSLGRNSEFSQCPTLSTQPTLERPSGSFANSGHSLIDGYGMWCGMSALASKAEVRGPSRTSEKCHNRTHAPQQKNLTRSPSSSGRMGLGQAERLSEISTGCEDLTASNYSYI